MMTDSDATPVGMIRPIEAGRPVAPRPGPDGFVEDDEYEEYVDGVRRRKRKRTWVVRLVVALVVIFLLMFGYFLVSLYQVWSTGRNDQARQVDAIVVLGAAQYDGKPSPQLAARLDQVLAPVAGGIRPPRDRHGWQTARRPVHRGADRSAPT